MDHILSKCHDSTSKLNPSQRYTFPKKTSRANSDISATFGRNLSTDVCIAPGFDTFHCRSHNWRNSCPNYLIQTAMEIWKEDNAEKRYKADSGFLGIIYKRQHLFLYIGRPCEGLLSSRIWESWFVARLLPR